MTMERRAPSLPRESTTLADLLDRVLDKGLVVAGDVSISLANVELLTIQLRLVICSIDKAEAIGINWWRSDRFYSGDRALQDSELTALKARIDELEEQLKSKELPSGAKSAERKGR